MFLVLASRAGQKLCALNIFGSNFYARCGAAPNHRTHATPRHLGQIYMNKFKQQSLPQHCIRQTNEDEVRCVKEIIESSTKLNQNQGKCFINIHTYIVYIQYIYDIDVKYWMLFVWYFNLLSWRPSTALDVRFELHNIQSIRMYVICLKCAFILLQFPAVQFGIKFAIRASHWNAINTRLTPACTHCTIE